jgi:hypothetical protein
MCAREEVLSAEQNRDEWHSWQEGLSVKVTLPKELPPLRMLVVWDNLTGHTSAELLLFVDVRQRDHGTLHAAGRQLVEHERVYPAHPCASSTGRRASAPARADHRMAGGDGTRMESRSDAF